DMATVALGYMVGPEHSDSKFKQCDQGQVFDPSRNADTGCAPAPAMGAGELPTSGYIDRGSSNSKGLRHFLDLTAVVQPIDQLKLLVNGSLGIDKHRSAEDEAAFLSATWWGIMVGARYAVSEQFGVAGRGEYFADPDGYAIGSLSLGHDISIVTGT